MQQLRSLVIRWAALPMIVTVAGAGSVLALGATVTTGLQATTSTSTTTTPSSSTSAGSASTPATSVATTLQQQRLAIIKPRGDAEITRRLTQLGKLSSVITATTKLSASDKSTLSTQVSNEITGLTSLKTKLDSETTLAGAAADVSSMVTEYRVYALITPKVRIIQVADAQQTNELALTNLATKLELRITTAKQSGKDVSSLQAELDDLNTQVKSAQAISAPMEAAVIGLQPSDYDSNHGVLSGDLAQLQAAHAENEAAYADAQGVVKGLESL